MRPHGTAQQLEARRRRAAELLQQGKTLTEVARLVGSSVSSVSRWRDALDRGGEQALAPKPAPGRPAWLSEAQRRRLLRVLQAGPRRQGFATDLWTCARVGQVIRRLFGVRYHVDYVGTLLHKLGWSPQKPALQARERDETAIAAWRSKTWPRLKKEARKTS
jgi:transposase